MTRGRLIGASIAVFMLLFSQAAWAQTTGAIRGRTVDTDGQALPGVTVVVTGELLGSAQRTTVTSPSGGFLFTAMPIGNFTVTATLEGYQSQAAEDVRVAIDAVATVDFSMPEAFSEEITVIAETPVIDTASPSFGAAYDADQIKDLPTRGNFYDTLAVAPGVAADRENIFLLSPFGSDVQSNQWNIDGLDSTSPEAGDVQWSMTDELIAELQMVGTGAGAEYGSMLGSAFNVVTKSGTNEFHGSAVLDYWVPDWVSTNAIDEDAPEGAQNYRLDHHNNLVLTLGGPIAKDHLWFFAATEWGRVLEYWPYEEELPGQVESTWDNYDLKLTAQLGGNHRLNLRVGDHDYVGPSVGDVYSEPTNWGEDQEHTKMFSLDYSAVLGDNTFLEARAGGWRTDYTWGPQVPSDEWMFVDKTVDPWVYSGGMWWTWEWDPQTDDAEVILSQHAEDFIKGDHEFKFGVQYKKGSANTKLFDTSYYYQAESYYYSYYYGYGYYYTWQGLYYQTPFYYGAISESSGAFVTDSWQVSDRLTVEAGVRYDRHQARVPDYPRLDADSNPTGESIPGRDMVDWTSVDPRLGFAWQPTDSGKTLVRGSIGRFHAGPVFGQWYWPPPEMPATVGYWLNGDGEWEQTWTWEASDALLVDGTENAHTWEYTLGVEHQVGATSSFGVQAVYKKTEDLIGWYLLDDAPYETFTYIDPWNQQEFLLRDYGGGGPTTMKGNSSGPGANPGDRPYEQEYQGLVFTFKKRFSNNWDMLASYTLSKSEGLNPTFLDWGSQGYVMYWFNDETDPNAHLNADKALNADRRHMFRVVANYMAPWQIKLSTVVNFQTGRPYDRYAFVQEPSTWWRQTRVIAEPASYDQRYPDQFLWDLSIGKHFDLGKGTNLSVDLQMLNILNDDAVEGWRSREFNPDEKPVPSLWVLPRRAELRLRFEF